MNLLKTLAAIFSMTMLSRITGLLRDILFASVFGATGLTDAFNIAFRIPNLLRRLFAEGAFSQAFVPMLAEYKNQQGERATKALVDHVATVLVWATVLTSVVGMIGAPVFVYLLASGKANHPESFDAAVWMTRLMFPYIVCMSLVALSSGILNTWRQFKVPAFTPVLLNLSFISCTLLLAPHLKQPVYAMAIAVLIGGLLQVAIQLPFLRKLGMLPRLSWDPRIGLADPGVRRILKNMVPALFAVSVAQISLMINTTYASWMQEGAVSWLTYADRLMEFPNALLGVALGTILLPSLSKASLEKDDAEYSALLDWGLRLTFLLAMPAAVGICVLSLPMIATLFHRGQFTDTAALMTTQPLVAYAVGLLGIILVKSLTPAYYARQDVRTPVRIGLITLVATQAMNLAFVWQFKVAGLALSISIAALLNAALLFRGLRLKGIYLPQPGWPKFFVRLLLAVLLMGVVGWFGAQQFDWLGMRNHGILRAGALFLVIGACVVVYFGTLFALGFRVRDFRRRAK